MATFGNARDKDLPLLTRAYQVDVNDWRDVAAFLRSESDLWGGWDIDPEEAGQLTAEAQPGWNDEQKRSFRASVAYELHAAREEVAQVLSLTQEAMDSLYERRTVRQSVLNHLGKKMQKHPYFMQKEEEETPQTPRREGDEEVPVESLTMAEAYPGNHVAIRLIEALVRLVLDCAEGAHPLARCVECGSAFVLQRPGQAYCSHRCSHRAGQRRRAADLRA